MLHECATERDRSTEVAPPAIPGTAYLNVCLTAAVAASLKVDDEEEPVVALNPYDNVSVAIPFVMKHFQTP